MLTSTAVEWPQAFYAVRRGEGCGMCAQGRPEEVPSGTRIFAGSVSDAYLQRADIQRGYTVVVWRGRHVAEPTELSREEAAAYWLEVLRVARALERHLQPVKMNYNVLGNSLPHLHTHVLPRYADDPRPGWPFPFPETDPSSIDERAFTADVAALRRLLDAPDPPSPSGEAVTP
jgi:diadenosine tetraphosphate (Ap4A) HIT family hydrolase